MRLRSIVVLSALAGTCWAAPVLAETYRFESADGTVHFTNAPTDPRYLHMSTAPPAVSGTAAGWLRLPAASPATYAAEIRDAAYRYGVPENLVSAVIRAESGFNPRAVSPKGARGLMQLMPETASLLGVRNAFDPVENIDGGVRHLRGLMERFGDDLPLVLAAYNAGEQAVVTYRGIPPFAETQQYVARVLGFIGHVEGRMVGAMRATYRMIRADGAIVYTNIPPAGRR